MILKAIYTSRLKSLSLCEKQFMKGIASELDIKMQHNLLFFMMHANNNKQVIPFAW